MAFIRQPLSVVPGLVLLFNLLSFRVRMVFVLTELAREVNISDLIGEGTGRPSSWQERSRLFHLGVVFNLSPPRSQLALTTLVYSYGFMNSTCIGLCAHQWNRHQ